MVIILMIPLLSGTVHGSLILQYQRRIFKPVSEADCQSHWLGVQQLAHCSVGVA
jgi:hypothetical protein